MRTIAIAAGGDSPEYGVSIKSASEVARALSTVYEVFVIVIRGNSWYWEESRGRRFPVDRNDFTLRLDERRVKFDAVFIAIHGTPGENGLLQGYFDMLKIPYTSCGAFCSALTFNKHATKLYLKEYGIPMAGALLIRKGDKPDTRAVISRTGLPCFVKPNDSGSSFGVSKVKTEDELLPAINKAFAESNEVLAEVYMNGREVACGVVRTGDRELILPVTEIIPKNEFFDYEAKYTPGKSDEITPAAIGEKLTAEVQQLSSAICGILACRGIVRVDFIIVEERPLFLEINTVPGMSSESLIPKQAAAAGISLTDLYSSVIESLFA